jgi:hypothetical protein
MQTKFLTIYHKFDDAEYSKQKAQDDLLYMWKRNLQLKQIKFIRQAKVSFKDYSLLDYPNLDKAKKEVWRSYVHIDTYSKQPIWRWGKYEYTDFEKFYLELAKQKRLMELTITVEDEE